MNASHAAPAALLFLAAAASSTVHAQQIIDGGSTVTVPGTNSSPWSFSGRLIVGDATSGTLSIGAGGIVSSTHANVGDDAGSTGTITVSGAGSRWSTAYASSEPGELGMILGNLGAADLTISGGGAVHSGSHLYLGYGATGSASVTVTGAGSRLSTYFILNAGYAAGSTASVTITDGGTAAPSGVGIGLDGTGHLLVSGTGSNITTNAGDISFGGLNSTMRVEQGGTATSFRHMQLFSNSAAVVTGSGSTVTVPQNFRLNGTSTFTVENGAKLSTTSTAANPNYVGYDTSSDTAMKVTGTGSQWAASSEIVVARAGSSSNRGESSLTIADGGNVTIAGGTGRLVLGGGNYSTGTLNIGEGGAAGTLAASEVTVSSTSSLRAGQVNFNHDDTATFSVPLNGARLGVAKNGTGTTILTGASSYGQATIVNAGSLYNNGSLGATAVTVAAGAAFGGSGTHTGSILLQDGAVLEPGAAGEAGTLSSGSATLAAGSGISLHLSNVEAGAGQGWDLISLAGALVLDGTVQDPIVLTLEVAGSLFGFDPAQDHAFTIATAAGGISGFSADAVEIDAAGIPDSPAGIWSLGQSGNSLILSYSAVPEPSSSLMIALSASAALLKRRRK